MARHLPALGGSLGVLALSHNSIGTDGARALAAALPTCAGLEVGGTQPSTHSACRV